VVVYWMLALVVLSSKSAFSDWVTPEMGEEEEVHRH